MKIQLSIDRLGNPILEIQHLDKSQNLDQKLLGVFIERAMQNGIVIENTNALLSDTESYVNYIIKVLG